MTEMGFVKRKLKLLVRQSVFGGVCAFFLRIFELNVIRFDKSFI